MISTCLGCSCVLVYSQNNNKNEKSQKERKKVCVLAGGCAFKVPRDEHDPPPPLPFSIFATPPPPLDASHGPREHPPDATFRRPKGTIGINHNLEGGGAPLIREKGRGGH